MADFRRYQPRHSAATRPRLNRWVVFGVAGILVIILAKVIFGTGGEGPTSNTADSGISLVTDNTNTVTNNGTNTNATTSTNTAAAASGSWQGFTVKQCPTAISSAGAAKQVVLTVALSAANEAATNALNALKFAGVPADFFSTGTFATKNPAFVKTVADAGYAVYSQSYDSTNLTTLSAADLVSAISRAETAITAASGESPKPVFRPPSGSYNAAVLKTLGERGYCTVLWTVDAYDWDEGNTTLDQAEQRVLTAVEKQSGGSIVALHAGYDMTAELITDLVASLKDQGYSFVDLATLLNSPT